MTKKMKVSGQTPVSAGNHVEKGIKSSQALTGTGPQTASGRGTGHPEL